MPPVRPPVSPMLARPARELPPAGGYLYEPKWDGFRTLVFARDGTVELHSRNERPLARYFPELVGPLAAALGDGDLVDGEVVVAGPHGLDFDALLQRLHPAESRVRRLAAATPASFVAFDLVAAGDEDLRGRPFAERRERLVELLGPAAPPVHVTPATADRAVALDWFSRFEGAGLDGVVAKSLDLAYREGERAMIKVKHERTADCVVGGWRPHAHGGVGSLLLGLFDDRGVLHRVGVCSGFSAAVRRQLEAELGPHALPDGAPHPWAGGGTAGDPEPASRWNRGRDTSWHPLVPELVCEVAYDHLQGPRFRHATAFRRRRPERTPTSCRFDQLDSPVPAELRDLFGTPVTAPAPTGTEPPPT